MFSYLLKGAVLIYIEDGVDDLSSMVLYVVSLWSTSSV